MTSSAPGPAPGTDAQNVTEDPDTKPAAKPEPDDGPAADEGETTGLAEG